MGDAIGSFVSDRLKTTFFDWVSEEVRLLFGVDPEEVKKNLESKLCLIEAVLQDAEKKKRTNNFLKKWVEKVKEVSYDIEDVLDELRTAAEIKAQNAASQEELPWGRPTKRQRLGNFISGISSGRDIALNIKEINQRLDDIVKEKEKYQLLSMPESNIINQPQQRPETSSFVDVSKLCGRNKVKAEILNHLWGGNGEEEAGEPIPTISIVGMGGLGKTALAQLLCNDNDVQRHFDKVIWVCVSNFFYEKKVARAIIQGLEELSDSAAYCLESNPWHVLLERISKSIGGKKYFLVLDDIWDGVNGERWEELKTAFRLGASESRILVTTRDVEVAKMMGSSSSQIISLEKLGDKQCWSIIKNIALGGRDNQNLEKIGREIAKKCAGLPLVAKTLGGLLKSKTSRQEWQSVLNSEIWKLELAHKDILAHKGIFASLLLSYYDLPLPVQQCFVYCVLFPKDYIIYPDSLIPQWMAMGYLGSDGNADLESKGKEYFHILADRSFFQDFEILDKKIHYCKMHDIVHDFAGYLVGDEFATMKVNSDHLPIDKSESRHLTVMIDEGIAFPISIPGGEKLRVLVTLTGPCALTSKALDSLFNQCRRVRALIFGLPTGSVTTNRLCKEIPEGIGKLIHLRFLDLNCSVHLERLPEALCNLLNLEYLNLQDCEHLKQLPDSIEKLINLRYLSTFGCFALTHYPKGVRKLTSLRRLWGLIARADCDDTTEFSLADLGNLKHLYLLHLEVVGDSIDMAQAKKGRLQDVQHLHIFLGWSSIQKKAIRKALDPHKSIPDFRFLEDYAYPRWMPEY